MENPFTPNFGETPAHLAGRNELVTKLEKAFVARSRRPELTTMLYGARGSGKTTLLSVASHVAERNGWVAVGVTAMEGMLDEIEVGVLEAVSHLPGFDSAGGKKVAISGMSIPHLVDVDLASEEPKSTWRSRMTSLLKKLTEAEVGLLITVDEVDPINPEMITLAATYQHFVRENLKVGLLMAGLPHNISHLHTDKTVSFLRRSQMYNLGRIADIDVKLALIKTIRDSGRTIDAEPVNVAVRAIDGFAYLVQLIGFRMWDAHPDEPEISLDDVHEGIALAREEMENRILASTMEELSPADVSFLSAMLEDPEISAVADLATRLGWKDAQVGQYRRRLIEAGIIGARGRGRVGFDLPYFREFLADQVTS